MPATLLTVLSRWHNAQAGDVNFQSYPAEFIPLDLVNDYFIWTKGSAIVTDLMTHEPTPTELNAAATPIDPSLDTTIALCLLMDASHNVGGSYYTHTVYGMSLNKQFVFGFSFNGATATEPQLEAWDDSSHTTAIKNVLGAGTAANSLLKGICTTNILPGTNWAGAPLAGASNVLLLNAGGGALGVLGSGITSQELYSNLKIVIPAALTPSFVESFVTTVRYTYA